MKGTYFRKDRNKWLATAMIDRKRIYIGLFVNQAEAKEAYDNVIKRLKTETKWQRKQS